MGNEIYGPKTPNTGPKTPHQNLFGNQTTVQSQTPLYGQAPLHSQTPRSDDQNYHNNYRNSSFSSYNNNYTNSSFNNTTFDQTMDETMDGNVGQTMERAMDMVEKSRNPRDNLSSSFMSSNANINATVDSINPKFAFDRQAGESEIERLARLESDRERQRQLAKDQLEAEEEAKKYVHYSCGDCYRVNKRQVAGFVGNEKRQPVRCEHCGFRILYKIRNNKNCVYDCR